MKIIVVAHRNDKRPPEDFAPFLEPEAKKALQLMAEDFAREIYSFANGKGAIMVVEAENEEQVRARLAELPFVQNDLLSLEIYPVGPYRGIVAAAKA